MTKPPPASTVVFIPTGMYDTAVTITRTSGHDGRLALVRYDNAARGNCFDTATLHEPRRRAGDRRRRRALCAHPPRTGRKTLLRRLGHLFLRRAGRRHPGNGRRRPARQRRGTTAHPTAAGTRRRRRPGPDHRVRRRPAQRRTPAGAPPPGPGCPCRRPGTASRRPASGTRSPGRCPGRRPTICSPARRPRPPTNSSAGAWSCGWSPTTTWTGRWTTSSTPCWPCRAATLRAVVEVVESSLATGTADQAYDISARTIVAGPATQGAPG